MTLTVCTYIVVARLEVSSCSILYLAQMLVSFILAGTPFCGLHMTNRCMTEMRDNWMEVVCAGLPPKHVAIAIPAENPAQSLFLQRGATNISLATVGATHAPISMCHSSLVRVSLANSLTSHACICVQVVSSLVPAEVWQGNGDPASIPLPTTDAAELQLAVAWQVCPFLYTCILNMFGDRNV